MQVTEGSRTGVEEDSVERDLNSGPCPVPLTRPTDCLYDCLPRCHVVFFLHIVRCDICQHLVFPHVQT